MQDETSTVEDLRGAGIALALGLSAAAGAQTPTASLTADTTAAGKHMSDDLYGIFYEDINHAADGGLYAELVQNRSFEFSTVDNGSYTPTTAWSVSGGTMAVGQPRIRSTRRTSTSCASPAPRRCATAASTPASRSQAGKKYDVSFWARAAAPATVRAAVDGATDAFTATVDSAWKKYTGVLTASATTTTGRLQLVTDGSVDLDMVSLFPQDTFMGRANGLRKDIAQKIADLNPSFMRFPGGCIVNMNSGSGNNYGDYTNARARVYRWKETIGPVEERPTNRNMWGYNQSYGLGYMEYFQYSEDIGASPLPVVPVGTNSCGGTTRLTTDAQLEPWIQDTLDLIQFANGSIATEWGAKRAALGHPAPFNLKYLGLGNEESDPQWNINFPKFVQRIRAVYPDVKLIATSGWAADGTEFQRNWTTARQTNANLVDEHYYPGPEWFLSNSHRYDNYDRNGPHVFVGEYATRSTYDRAFNSGLAEAAFMTGLERNSDVVDLASYAPLLANVDYVNWEPDLLYYDNSRIFGTPSYYVQKLFSNNRGDTIVPSTLTGDSSTPVETPITGRIGLATWSTQAAYDNVKVTAKDGTVLFSDDFSGGAGQWTPSSGTWSVVDGEYRQTGTGTDLRSIAGNASWNNYTLELDARKISGARGLPDPVRRRRLQQLLLVEPGRLEQHRLGDREGRRRHEDQHRRQLGHDHHRPDLPPQDHGRRPPHHDVHRRPQGQRLRRSAEHGRAALPGRHARLADQGRPREGRQRTHPRDDRRDRPRRDAVQEHRHGDEHERRRADRRQLVRQPDQGRPGREDGHRALATSSTTSSRPPRSRSSASSQVHPGIRSPIRKTDDGRRRRAGDAEPDARHAAHASASSCSARTRSTSPRRRRP